MKFDTSRTRTSNKGMASRLLKRPEIHNPREILLASTERKEGYYFSDVETRDEDIDYNFIATEDMYSSRGMNNLLSQSTKFEQYE